MYAATVRMLAMSPLHLCPSNPTETSTAQISPTLCPAVLQVPLQYQQDLLDKLDAAAAVVEDVDNSATTMTVITQVWQ